MFCRSYVLDHWLCVLGRSVVPIRAIFDGQALFHALFWTKHSFDSSAGNGVAGGGKEGGLGDFKHFTIDTFFVNIRCNSPVRGDCER